MSTEFPQSPRPESYRDIRLEDIDRAVYDWFDSTVDVHVNMPDGRQGHKVPVILSSKERWVSSRENVAPRDPKGKVILPAISITRTGVDPTNSMLALGSNVPRLTVSRRVSPKTSVLQSNRERLPLSQRGRDRVVYEVATIPFPFNGNVRYEVSVHTSYIQHMNSIIEKIVAEMEFYDVPCFVSMLGDNRPGPLPEGDTTEREPAEDSPFESRGPLDDYYICGYFDEQMSSDGNLDEFTDQERVFRYRMGFTVPAYLQLDPSGKREAVQVEQTAFQVDFGRESCHFIDDPGEIELIFDPANPLPIEKLRRR